MSAKANPYIPNTTPNPNIVYDQWMAVLTGAEYKCLSYLVRCTYGFHKEEQGDCISINQFMTGIVYTKGDKAGTRFSRGTGLSKETVCVALDVLCETGLVVRQNRANATNGDLPNHYVLCFDIMEVPEDDEIAALRKHVIARRSAEAAAKKAGQNAKKSDTPLSENPTPTRVRKSDPPVSENFDADHDPRVRKSDTQKKALHDLQKPISQNTPPNPQMGEGLTPRNGQADGQEGNLSKESEAQADAESEVPANTGATPRQRKPKAKPSERQRELLRAFNATKHENCDPEPSETEAHKYAPLLAKALTDGYTPATVRYATHYVLSFVTSGKWSSDEYVTPNSAIQRIPELVRRGAITKSGEVLIPLENLHEHTANNTNANNPNHKHANDGRRTSGMERGEEAGNRPARGGSAVHAGTCPRRDGDGNRALTAAQIMERRIREQREREDAEDAAADALALGAGAGGQTAQSPAPHYTV